MIRNTFGLACSGISRSILNIYKVCPLAIFASLSPRPATQYIFPASLDHLGVLCVVWQRDHRKGTPVYTLRACAFSFESQRAVMARGGGEKRGMEADYRWRYNKWNIKFHDGSLSRNHESSSWRIHCSCTSYNLFLVAVAFPYPCVFLCPSDLIPSFQTATTSRSPRNPIFFFASLYSKVERRSVVVQTPRFFWWSRNGELNWRSTPYSLCHYYCF